ncbi:class IIb bacteriocin, lactobin A/cerein 7B family [Fructilactobacillus frigidiflavus]|uniref:class IIb bacteriocin, lactobin A/cerein 7B family n=1 Tax=Fructilactobacillus frigidiflavus TaxID=3242688 RepID=UPI00375704A7
MKLENVVLLKKEELSDINGGWSRTGFMIAGAFGVPGVAAYSLYQFGMDQGYRNNRR